jgi:hypothetical protein
MSAIHVRTPSGHFPSCDRGVHRSTGSSRSRRWPEGDESSECRGEPGTLVIGNDQWPFKFSIGTLPEHVRALHERELT